MDNGAKALEISAGVLLAVMILAFVIYFFSTLGQWPEQEENQLSTEQLAKFNREYEVYDKKLMYGVDVISCLNKAKSNNEKYIEGKGFLSGSKSSEADIKVDVYVSIKTPLDEVIEIYYIDESTNKEMQRFDTTSTEYQNLSEMYSKNLDILGLNDKIGNTDYYTELKQNDPLSTKSNILSNSNKYIVQDRGTDINGKKYYSLNDSEVESLLRFASDNPKIVISNTNNETLKYWSKAVWSTALYSFKTKRFTCDKIEYTNSRKN